MKETATRYLIISAFLLATGFGVAGAIGAAAVVLLKACGVETANLSDAGILLLVVGVSVAAIVALDRWEGARDTH